jgi:ABC-2 type transport system permease protein
MQFPRLVIPLSVVLEGLFNLGLNLVAVFIFLPIAGVSPSWSWLGLPLIVAGLTVVTLGTSTLLAALYVRFRDIAQIWSVLTLVLFYSSPVLYPANAIPHSLRPLLLVNPFAPLLETANRWVVDPTAPSVVDQAGSALGWIGPILVTIGIVAVGFWVFFREAPRVAEEL